MVVKQIKKVTRWGKWYLIKIKSKKKCTKHEGYLFNLTCFIYCDKMSSILFCIYLIEFFGYHNSLKYFTINKVRYYALRIIEHSHRLRKMIWNVSISYYQNKLFFEKFVTDLLDVLTNPIIIIFILFDRCHYLSQKLSYTKLVINIIWNVFYVRFLQLIALYFIGNLDLKLTWHHICMADYQRKILQCEPKLVREIIARVTRFGPRLINYFSFWAVTNW